MICDLWFGFINQMNLICDFKSYKSNHMVFNLWFRFIIQFFCDLVQHWIWLGLITFTRFQLKWARCRTTSRPQAMDGSCEPHHPPARRPPLDKHKHRNVVSPLKSSHKKNNVPSAMQAGQAMNMTRDHTSYVVVLHGDWISTVSRARYSFKVFACRRWRNWRRWG